MFLDAPMFLYIFVRACNFVYFTGVNILGLFKLGMILLLGIVFVYIRVINDCVLYIIIFINDLSSTF